MRGGGLHPNRPPKTFARTRTIAEELTDVSIHDKGPGTPRRMPRPPVVASQCRLRHAPWAGRERVPDPSYLTPETCVSRFFAKHRRYTDGVARGLLIAPCRQLCLGHLR